MPDWKKEVEVILARTQAQGLEDERLADSAPRFSSEERFLRGSANRAKLVAGDLSELLLKGDEDG